MKIKRNSKRRSPTRPAIRHGGRGKRGTADRGPKIRDTDRWRLRLYVAGQTPKSLTAFANLKRLCEEHLPGRYQIEVIDLMRAPQLAQSDHIIALPTLVRRLPQPIKRIIGDLSDVGRVMVGMDLQPVPVKRMIA